MYLPESAKKTDKNQTDKQMVMKVIPPRVYEDVQGLGLPVEMLVICH